jgi:hypothetical protein
MMSPTYIYIDSEETRAAAGRKRERDEVYNPKDGTWTIVDSRVVGFLGHLRYRRRVEEPETQKVPRSAEDNLVAFLWSNRWIQNGISEQQLRAAIKQEMPDQLAALRSALTAEGVATAEDLENVMYACSKLGWVDHIRKLRALADALDKLKG